MILAGDAGGTKVRLALFPEELFLQWVPGEAVRCDDAAAVERYSSREADSLESLVQAFLEGHGATGEISAVCIGAPGPVVGGAIKTTNLPWEIRAEHVAAAARCAKICLVNDLVATIAAVPVLGADEQKVIYPGAESREKRVFAIVAPGTGLGEALLVVDDTGQIHPLASEGGHVEFAPKNDTEIDLLRWLRDSKRHRISIERILSGPGLANVYEFLHASGRESEPAELRAEIEGRDPAPIITKHALAETFPICTKALEIFVRVLGSHAGDVVLTALASGGLYLGGGIPPKILPFLSRGLLEEAYLDKGRLSPFVQSTPIAVITDDRAALVGAGLLASKVL